MSTLCGQTNVFRSNFEVPPAISEAAAFSEVLRCIMLLLPKLRTGPIFLGILLKWWNYPMSAHHILPSVSFEGATKCRTRDCNEVALRQLHHDTIKCQVVLLCNPGATTAVFWWQVSTNLATTLVQCQSHCHAIREPRCAEHSRIEYTSCTWAQSSKHRNCNIM